VRYYYKGVLWSPGYFASSCGGAPISVIRQYIEQQQTPGQVENRALYPRPEGRGFTAHRINPCRCRLKSTVIALPVRRISTGRRRSTPPIPIC
ncbi:transposase, partial [Escherichia coli]|uniref:transposase n=1 Tax=Escherichia coli TaxID=562 RepID=UPI001FCED985